MKTHTKSVVSLGQHGVHGVATGLVDSLGHVRAHAEALVTDGVLLPSHGFLAVLVLSARHCRTYNFERL